MWLIVVSGTDSGKQIPVTGGRLIVGRDPTCDLVLADERVSRRHAALDVVDDGRTVLRNLASRNGTFVDGRRVEESLVLEGDERIVLGDTVLLASAHEPTGDVDRAEKVGAGAEPAPSFGQSAVRRLVLDTLRAEVKGVQKWSRRATVIRALSGVAGSAAVAILWRIFS
jgi:two-component system, NtrC family, response regulator GlrR